MGSSISRVLRALVLLATLDLGMHPEHNRDRASCKERKLRLSSAVSEKPLFGSGATEPEHEVKQGLTRHTNSSSRRVGVRSELASVVNSVLIGRHLRCFKGEPI